jgi:hypothetical protein
MADLRRVPHGGLRLATGSSSGANETLYVLTTRSEFEMTRAENLVAG